MASEQTPSPTPSSTDEWLILSFAESREQRKELGRLIDAVGDLTKTVQSFHSRLEKLEIWQQTTAPILSGMTTLQNDMTSLQRDNRKTLATFTTIGTIAGYVAGVVSQVLHLFPQGGH